MEVDGKLQPRILSLRHILDEYIAYQEQVITRRTQYDLRKAQERAHLLEGLLIAQDNIDEVIRIIRTSYDNAKDRLMERFGLDDVQAQAICDMRLISLQGLNREKLEAEYKELEERIAYFQKLLADETMLRGVLKDELTAIRDKYGDDRYTEIQDVEDEIDIEDLIEEEQCVFTLTQAGYIKRTPVSEYAAQSKGGMGKKGITTREEDYVVDVFTASTHDHMLFFTNTGKVYRKKGYQIPQAGKTAKGTNIVNILQVEPGERVQTMIHTASIQDDGRYLVMVTRNGTVKRLPANALKNLRNNGIRALRMEEGDELISVRETDGTKKILIATHDGMAVCFDENDVRPMAGRPWASGASSSGRGTMWWGPPGPPPERLSSPSRRTATASALPWRSTASPTGAAWASKTMPSPRRPGPSWASRWWMAPRTCCWSPRRAS